MDLGVEISSFKLLIYNKALWISLANSFLSLAVTSYNMSTSSWKNYVKVYRLKEVKDTLYRNNNKSRNNAHRDTSHNTECLNPSTILIQSLITR